MPQIIRLSQPQRARLSRLLHMEYRAGELADAIGCHREQILGACDAGCPYRETATGRCFLVGDAFAAWYEAQVLQRKHPLRDDEAFCLRCRAAVTVVDACVVPTARADVERVTGRCARCGGEVNRYRRVV